MNIRKALTKKNLDRVNRESSQDMRCLMYKAKAKELKHALDQITTVQQGYADAKFGDCMVFKKDVIKLINEIL